MRGTDLKKEKRVFRFFSLIRVWDTREYYMKEKWIKVQEGRRPKGPSNPKD